MPGRPGSRSSSRGDVPGLASIIVPSHNYERYVAEAIESALDQTYSPLEVIVIDDGSTDGSLEVIRSFGDRIRHEATSNRGPGAARNRGLKLARGEFIQFLDADDILLPEKVEQCVDRFDEDVHAVFSERTFFTESDCHKRGSLMAAGGRLVRWIWPGGIPWDPANQLEYMLRSPIGTPGPVHKRRHLLEVGGFREDMRVLEDIELHFRMSLAGFRFRKIDSVLVRCRDHGSPGRLRYQPRRDELALKGAYMMYEEAARAQALSERIRSALADLFANHGRKACWSGAKDEGLRAFEMARRLHRFPRPTGFPVYNALSRILGLERTEAFFMRLRNTGRPLTAGQG